MKVFVCEDKREDSDKLCSFINKFFEDMSCSVHVSVYGSGEAFLHEWEMFESEGAEIAFLDIYMPGMTGIEVAKKIRQVSKDMVIIFTTTSFDHGLDGFAVRALQYLVKPLKYTDVESALSECMNLFADSLQFIEVLSDRKPIKVLLKDIRYIESFRNICHIHTVSEMLKSYCALDDIERQLSGRTFLRTHRSYIVNMSHVKSIVENNFLLTDGRAVPISRNNRSYVRKAYMEYAFARTREG